MDRDCFQDEKWREAICVVKCFIEEIRPKKSATEIKGT
jgi:hypothetical protein